MFTARAAPSCRLPDAMSLQFIVAAVQRPMHVWPAHAIQSTRLSVVHALTCQHLLTEQQASTAAVTLATSGTTMTTHAQVGSAAWQECSDNTALVVL